MAEGHLVQEAMGLCHDIIGDLDAYAPQAWKDEQDLHTIGNFSYKSHANLIPSLFTYLNSFSSIPLNENKGFLVNVVPKIEFKRIRQMVRLYSCGMKVFTHDSGSDHAVYYCRCCLLLLFLFFIAKNSAAYLLLIMCCSCKTLD
jgi:hypothetical protein